MDDYKIIVEQEHSTVMAHYDIPKKDGEGYQSEAKLEAALIRQLQGQRGEGRGESAAKPAPSVRGSERGCTI